MQVWCDLRKNPLPSALHTVFDNKLQYEGDGIILDADKLTLDGEIIGAFFPVHDRSTYEQARAKIGLVEWLLLDFSDWQMIPIENLIAECENSGTKLAIIVDAADEINGVAFALEKGVDAIIIEPNKPLITACEIAKSQRLERNGSYENNDMVSLESVSLTNGKIISIESGGSGERYCIDLTSLISPGEGMLIGSSASSLALIHGEVFESDFVPSRPFRVNAGPPHSYVMMADYKTKYLSELSSGDEVLVVSENGGTRPATIGRLKIERRPFLKIIWENVYQISNSIYLQQAETVRVVAGLGEVKSVTELKPGDSLLCHNSSHTRHIGNRVSTTSKEV